jgi:hypothetical protein
MEYKESDMLLEEDENDGGSESVLPPNILDMEEEELDTWPDELGLDALTKKSKASPVRFSLENRRRIEALKEERQLEREKEFDYGFDEASENNDVTKSE